MDKVKVFQPHYYKKFKCTGSECKNNCCRHNWQIRIDKGTYDKYLSLDDDMFSQLSENMKVMSEDPFLALILSDSDGNCKMLDDRGWCRIQLKHGHEFLCRTCRLYPRKTCLVDNETERFLELSCEVAAQLILFDQNIMKFEEAELLPIVDGRVVYNHQLEAQEYISSLNSVSIFWRLRITAIAIMQSRQYKVRLRMLILCLFIQQIDTLLAEGRESEITLVADEFMKQLDTGHFDTLRNQMPDGTAPEPGVILDVLGEMAKGNNIKLNNCIKQAMEGFGLQPDSLEVSEDFAENYKKYYNQYFSDKEYIFENYIVHNILSEGFPFNYKHETSVMKNYAELLAKFELIEFLFVGVSRRRMKFDKRTLIECIAFFTRSYDHNLKDFLIRD